MMHLFEFYSQGVRKEEDRLVAQAYACTLDQARAIVEEACGVNRCGFLKSASHAWVMRALPMQIAHAPKPGTTIPLTKGKI